MDVEATKFLIRATRSQIVINVGSPFLNMSVLAACIDTGAAYIDTAIHEDPAKVCETPPWYANYEWKRREACKDARVTAVLGVGFDPGVVNAYARYAVDHCFDQVESIDIIDINAGSHGRYFATNFDPEINFREFTSTVWSWEDNAWKANAMFEHRKEWTCRWSANRPPTSPATTNCTRCRRPSACPTSVSGWVSASTTSTSSTC
ncbi:saccharopine dehydrogenase family protein [Thauera humireducens]|uniref:saccharopine dehydrogenase family protein n=1 Tax=Thauera humireducens TaxID=1134435 RepID=UPI00311EE848